MTYISTRALYLRIIRDILCVPMNFSIIRMNVLILFCTRYWWIFMSIYFVGNHFSSGLTRNWIRTLIIQLRYKSSFFWILRKITWNSLQMLLCHLLIQRSNDVLKDPGVYLNKNPDCGSVNTKPWYSKIEEHLFLTK